MQPYIHSPRSYSSISGKEIAVFTGDDLNSDADTVESFGDEWTRFSSFTDEETRIAGDQYFDIVTDRMANENSVCLDIGCGTGRWSKYLSPRVKFIEAIDPSDAVVSAVGLTSSCPNIRITKAGYGCIPFEKESFDLVFSLGVVHHLPDTEAAVKEAASMVKKDGWLLLYIYYALDNRGAMYRFIFKCSDLLRKGVSSLPRSLKFLVCDILAIFVYMPFIALSGFLKLFGGKLWKKIPLSYYVDKPWKIIRNDSLDRFGTPLEKRFTKKEIEAMLLKAGMKNIRFSDNEPWWHVVASK